MALASVSIDYAGTQPAANLAAPTVSESIVSPNDRTFLLVVVGGTATTVTITKPGVDSLGRANVNLAVGPLTSTTRCIKIGREFRDPTTGNVAVAFSQVTAVTACVLVAPS